MQEVYHKMEELMDAGHVKSIGVSNFSVKKLRVQISALLFICRCESTARVKSQGMYVLKGRCMPCDLTLAFTCGHTPKVMTLACILSPHCTIWEVAVTEVIICECWCAFGAQSHRLTYR